MANTMNCHFANVGSKLASQISDSESEYMNTIYPPTFSLKEIMPNEVQEIIAKLSPSKACREDGVTAHLLKDAGDTVIGPLTHIFNMSIKTKCFPSVWKNAGVTPIFKDGERDDPNNYRQISLLPLISKVQERLVHNQLYEHLRKINYFCQKPVGVQEGVLNDHLPPRFPGRNISGHGGGGGHRSPLPGPQKSIRQRRP